MPNMQQPHQQGLEIQHVLLAQDDQGRRAAEGVAAVGLQPGDAAQPALPVLTAGNKQCGNVVCFNILVKKSTSGSGGCT